MPNSSLAALFFVCISALTAVNAPAQSRQVNRAPEWMGDLAQPGGFAIFLGNEMVGAIGAGGGIGNQDDECAQAAIKAVFPTASTSRAL